MRLSKKDLSSLHIREFNINDYNDVCALWDEAKLPYKPQGRDSKANIQWQITQSNTLYLVAEIQSKIIGVLFGSHDGRKGWVNRLAISPLYQQNGVATKLLTDFEQRLSAIGINIIAVLIEDWNTISMKVFKRWGYEKHSDILYFTKRKNYKV